MIRFLARALVAVSLVAGAGLVLPPTADAANGGIYGVVPTWGGWQCQGKFNNVAWVGYFNHSSGSNGGDSGDDIVWIPVNLKRDNTITMTIRCSFGTHLAMNYVIRPTRNKQSFFFNLNGSVTKN